METTKNDNLDYAILDIAESFNDVCPEMMGKYKKIGTQIIVNNVKEKATAMCVAFLNYLTDYGVPEKYKGNIAGWFRHDLFPIVFEKDECGNIVRWNTDMSTGEKTKAIWPYYYWIWHACWDNKNASVRNSVAYMKLVEQYRCGRNAGKNKTNKEEG